MTISGQTTTIFPLLLVNFIGAAGYSNVRSFIVIRVGF